MNMKRFSLLTLSVLVAGMISATKLYLAPDSVFYFPYADGTASVSGAIKQGDSLIIASYIMIPDSCLNAGAADPAHLSEYKVTVIGEGAFEVKPYTYVKLPDNLLRIDRQAFLSCTKMQKCDLPESIVEIEELAFFSCNKLKSINLPNIEKLGQQVFARCTGLETISVGDKLDSIHKSTFTTCNNLKTVQLGSGLKHIDQSAFSRCSALKAVSCGAVNPPVVHEKAFQYDDLSAVELQVPCASTSLYSKAPIWKDFAGVEAYSAYSFDVIAVDNLGVINIISDPNDCNGYKVEIEAVANTDYVFSRWSDNTTNPHYVFTLESDTLLYAYFDAVEKDTIYDTAYICENNYPYYWIEGEQYVDDAGTIFCNRVGVPHVYARTSYMLDFNEQDDLDTTICQGNMVIWRGNEYFDSGIYYDTLINQYGCDSILAMYLNVIPLYIVNANVECYNGVQYAGNSAGKVDIARGGDCNNTVTLTADVTGSGYFFSHWRIGEDAIADNPLVMDLTEHLDIRAIFYDDTHTALETLLQTNGQVVVYDLCGKPVMQCRGSDINNLPAGVYVVRQGEQIIKVIR